MPTLKQTNIILESEVEFKSPSTYLPMTQSNEPTIEQGEEKKYPVGGYAPGNYYRKCTTCDEQYQGDRRSFECEPCGSKSQAEWDALTPEQQEERVKNNMEVWNEFQNQQKQKDDNTER